MLRRRCFLLGRCDGVNMALNGVTVGIKMAFQIVPAASSLAISSCRLAFSGPQPTKLVRWSPLRCSPSVGGGHAI